MSTAYLFCHKTKQPLSQAYTCRAAMAHSHAGAKQKSSAPIAEVPGTSRQAQCSFPPQSSRSRLPNKYLLHTLYLSPPSVSSSILFTYSIIKSTEFRFPTHLCAMSELEEESDEEESTTSSQQGFLKCDECQEWEEDVCTVWIDGNERILCENCSSDKTCNKVLTSAKNETWCFALFGTVDQRESVKLVKIPDFASVGIQLGGRHPAMSFRKAYLFRAAHNSDALNMFDPAAPGEASWSVQDVERRFEAKCKVDVTAADCIVNGMENAAWRCMNEHTDGMKWESRQPLWQGYREAWGRLVYDQLQQKMQMTVPSVRKTALGKRRRVKTDPLVDMIIGFLSPNHLNAAASKAALRYINGVFDSNHHPSLSACAAHETRVEEVTPETVAAPEKRIKL